MDLRVEESGGGLDIAPVMANELRLKNITAKKGYDELLYEATVNILGEAVIGKHDPNVQLALQPEDRLWCKAQCPGCARVLKVLIVPGLDVIQCCFCAHWSFTNPLTLGEREALQLALQDVKLLGVAVGVAVKRLKGLHSPSVRWEGLQHSFIGPHSSLRAALGHHCVANPSRMRALERGVGDGLERSLSLIKDLIPVAGLLAEGLDHAP